MLSATELRELKNRFVNRYNRQHDSDVRPYRAGVTAASQRNILYAPDTSARRETVRLGWADELRGIAEKYVTPQSSEVYEQDLEHLQAVMNERFAGFFRQDEHPRYPYDPGFRLSHAQKSLSVCLKHLWCLGVVDTPPQCPVDSIVLGRAGLKYPQTRWAFVNRMEEHQSQMQVLERAAATEKLGVAEWELKEFPA